MQGVGEVQSLPVQVEGILDLLPALDGHVRHATPTATRTRRVMRPSLRNNSYFANVDSPLMMSFQTPDSRPQSCVPE